MRNKLSVSNFFIFLLSNQASTPISFNLTTLHSYTVRFRELKRHANNNIYYNIYYY